MQRFFETDSTKGINAKHADKLRVQLAMLDSAKSPHEVNSPNWNLHPLEGGLKGHWVLKVSGNWRLTFTFIGEDAHIVDYQDYH